MAQRNEEEYLANSDLIPPTNSVKGWLDYGRVTFSKNRKWIVGMTVMIGLGLLAWQIRLELVDAVTILSDQEAVSEYIQGFGILGPLVLGLGHYLQVIIAFIPGHVFVLAGGYLYGFIPGLILNMLFVVSASQFAFYLAKRAGRPFVGRFVDPATLTKWQTIADKRGIAFFTIAFILPVFPSDAMNFVAGLTGMAGRKFLIANFFGRLPSVAMMSFIGAYGVEFSNTAWSVLLVVVVLVYVIGRYTIMQIERQHSQPLVPEERDEATSSS